MIEPLGINMIQLHLSDDFGQAVEYDSIPDIGYRTIASEINQTDEGTAFTLYNRNRLEQMVDWGHQVGIQLVPEINLATNGGGWFKTGLLMDCPQMLCDKGHGIVFDVINKIESVMPIVLAAIAELRGIFSLSPSNKFFHLGFDQREMAIDGCFAEAGHGTSKAYAALHRFESKLLAAISLIGIDHNNIIRWHNEEKVEYQDRTGKITHYTDADDYSAPDYESGYELTPFFGTVVVTDEMTPWEVYQGTRRWTIKSSTPHGLVAKGIHGQVPRLDQLVAFVMGLRGTTKSEAYPANLDSFQTEFEIMCKEFQCTNTMEHFVTVANAKSRSRPDVTMLMQSCID